LTKSGFGSASSNNKTSFLHPTENVFFKYQNLLDAYYIYMVYFNWNLTIRKAEAIKPPVVGGSAKWRFGGGKPCESRGRKATGHSLIALKTFSYFA
jgi:hypothetical protein